MYVMLLPVAFAVTLTTPAFAHEHAAHVHGIAKLEVAVEGNSLNLHLESPLDGVLGFEHAPGNAGERAAVVEMRRILANGGKLFVPTPAAQCTLKSVQIEAPTLDAKAAASDSHGDLDANFLFDCAQPAKLAGMEVKLFTVFPKTREVDAQVVSGKGQSAVRLNAQKFQLNW